MERTYSRRETLATGAAVVGTTALAGCSGILSSDGEFGFEDVVFTEGITNEVGEYTERDSYERGEQVIVYVEVVNPPTDGGTARLSYTFEAEGPNGDPWNGSERQEEWDDAEGNLLAIWEGFHSAEADETGEYEMSITVDDQVDGEQLTTTKSFTLE